MIIGIITALALLFGSGAFSFDHVKEAADKVIEDRDRAKQAIAVTKEADEALESFTDKLDEQAALFVELNANYNATREEMYVWSTGVAKDRREFFEQLVAFRFEFQSHLTEAEFEEIVKLKNEFY
jgi:hypothetical protein